MKTTMQYSFTKNSNEHSPNNTPQQYDMELLDIDTPSTLDSPDSQSNDWPNTNCTNHVLVLDFERDRTTTSEIPITPKEKTEYKIHGVNVLNRQSINGFKAIEKVRRRRQSHALSERKRTSTMNGLINELASTIPDIIEMEQKPAKSEILRRAVEYIKQLQVQNHTLKSELGFKMSPPTSMSSASPDLDNFTSNNELYTTITKPPLHQISNFRQNYSLGISHELFDPTQTNSIDTNLYNQHVKMFTEDD